MVTDSLLPTQSLQHSSGAIGSFYRVVPSPFYAEEVAGIERVMVLTAIPGGKVPCMGWDWWLMDDCISLPPAPLSTGAAAVVYANGLTEEAVIMGVGYDQVCLMFPDGAAGWMSLAHIAAVVTPLTNSLASIA